MSSTLALTARRVLAIAGVGALILILSAGAALANPASPVVRTFQQPDGNKLLLRLWGDEFANGYETLQGETVIQNQTSRFWEYAVLDADGALRPSGIIVGRGEAPAEPNLRPSQDRINQERAKSGAPGFSPAAPMAAPPWASGATNILAIAIQFPADAGEGVAAVPCTFTAAQMQANLFGGAATGPGDMDDYYREISYNALNLTGTVVGCFTAANDKDDYDDGPSSAAALVAEAIAAADASVDFTPYDNDGNGQVDMVAIIYAGGGPDNGVYTGANATTNNLWPHASSIGAVAVDGGARTVSEYFMAAELLNAGTLRTIGVYAHEFGHKLGLPDLYDTDGSSEGVGHWSLMGSGSWASNTPGSENGESPSHMDPWSKWFMGWVTPNDYTGMAVNGPVPQVETQPFVVQLLANPGGAQIGGSGEYFLVENRQQTGFDRGLDGCGILAWHIDETKTSNATEGHTAATHRLVDLEEANGLAALDGSGNRGDAGMPFPGTSNNLLFDDNTNPTARLYSGAGTGIRMQLTSTACAPNMLVNFGDPYADLWITKSDSPDPVTAGELLTYFFTVKNEGPGSASNVVVTDVLPANVTYQTNTDNCTLGGGNTLTCTTANLASGATWSFSVLVKVNSGTASTGPTSLNNTATVAADQLDPNGGNNSDSETTIVVESADLRVIKECKPDQPLPAGQTATCTIYVDNLGPSDARQTSLVDSHVSNGVFAFGTITTSQGTCGTAGGVVTCNLGTLISGARATIVVPLTANEPQDVNDTATASSATPDPNLANNQASDGVQFVGLADLSITKSDAPDPVIAGTNLTYNLSVSNGGPSTAVNVVVSDRLPAGVSIISVTPSAGGACNAGEPGNAAKPTTCAFDSMAAASSATVQIVVRVLPATLGILHNDAQVSSSSLDLDNSDNFASTDTTVVGDADLALTKADNPDPVVAGTMLTYELTLTNNGPSKSIDPALVDQLPPEVVFQSYTISNGTGTCVLQLFPPNTVQCDLNDLDPGQFVKVFLQVLVKADTPNGAVINNSAIASAATPDSVPGNNTAAASTSVLASADLAIFKDALVDLQNPSPRVKYTIRVSNLGPSDAQNVVMTDPLPLDPKKIVYLYDNSAGACTYTLATHTFTCNFGTMPAGQTRSVELTVDVRGSVRTISNIATVTSTTTDPNLANNTVRKDVRIKGGPGR